MAGGSLLTKIGKAFDELQRLGFVDDRPTRLYGAQARGCNPIVAAVQDGTGEIRPVKARTIARSLAIGNPADGYYAARAIRQSGGWAEDVTDGEIVEGIRLLAATEGIFAETAGGVTVAAARKLVASGRLPRHEPIVLVITGNGLKTTDALAATAPLYPVIEPRLEAFEASFASTADLSSGSAPPGVLPSSGLPASAAPHSSARTL
jgi:threonine synthase